MVNYFPLVSTLISGAFAILLGIQYFQRRKSQQMIWTAALSMFFVATLLEFLAEPDVMGATATMYRLYYVLAAPMVALLGVGSLYLLTHKPWGKYFLIYTIILSIPLSALGFTAIIDASLLSEGFEVAGQAMPYYVRIFSPLFTIPGGILLIVGALYSYWLDRQRKYNLLIASGGVFPFLGGLMTRLNDPTFFFAFETLGTLLLLFGFLISREYTAKKREHESLRGFENA